MGFLDWIERIFNKKKKSSETEEKRICDVKGCGREAKGVCPYCGRIFCNLHAEPMDHDCQKRQFVNKEKTDVEKTPTIPKLKNKVPKAP